MSLYFTSGVLISMILLTVMEVSTGKANAGKTKLDLDLIFRDEIELLKYHKYLGKLDKKYYKDIFEDHLSREEKKQINYYEDLLKKVKQLTEGKKTR